MSTVTATQVLDREFLTVRCHLIDIAGALDRIGRAEGTAGGDPRWRQIHDALALLADGAADRAGRLQMALSLPYDANWRQTYGV